MEFRTLRARDGVYRWHLNRAVVLRDAEGKVLRFVGTTTDIDDQKRAEEALRASEANLRRVIDTIPSLSWCNLPDGPNEFLSKGWHDYTGLSPEEAHGWGWAAAFHPDDLPPLMKRWQELLVSGESGEIEARIRRRDGEYRWFLIRVAPFRDDTGAILRWYGTSTDIQERKLTDEALRASETNLRNVLDNIPGMVSMLGPTGGLELSNRPFLEYFNRTIEEIQNWSSNGLVHPDDLPNAIAAFTKSIETGEPLHLEHRLRRADGVYQWVLSSGRPVRDAEGRIERWYVLTTDIDDRKCAEDALRASENNFRQIVDNIPGLVATLSPRGEIELVNQQFLDYFGKSLDEINSWRVNDVLHPDDLHRVETAFSHAMTTGAAFVEELRYRRADGVHRWFHARLFPVLDPDGRIERWYALATDIEDQKRAEDALNELRSELAYMARVSSLGALTGSIAHEVNQPLSGIVTNASVCLRTLSSDPPNIDAAREAAQRMIRDGKRASEVIARLRALFSRKESTAEPVDLNEAAREVIALCLEELQKNRVILRQELANDLPRVTGDRVQLQQVMLNLLKNASDAMIGIDDRPRELVIRTEKDEGDCVRLTVKDSGVGIAPQDMERLFAAFYTTKSDGMGMGLSISRSIIERHSGRLWATHNDGPGAAFSFSMPCKFEAVASRPTTG
jgi:PAS domain S-box-containing protein